jgi:hypothetical protein
VAGSYEHGTELPDSIKDAKSLGQLLKKHCSVELIHAFLTCMERTLQFFEALEISDSIRH